MWESHFVIQRIFVLNLFLTITNWFCFINLAITLCRKYWNGCILMLVFCSGQFEVLELLSGCDREKNMEKSLFLCFSLRFFSLHHFCLANMFTWSYSLITIFESGRVSLFILFPHSGTFSVNVHKLFAHISSTLYRFVFKPSSWWYCVVPQSPFALHQQTNTDTCSCNKCHARNPQLHFPYSSVRFIPKSIVTTKKQSTNQLSYFLSLFVNLLILDRK